MARRAVVLGLAALALAAAVYGVIAWRSKSSPPSVSPPQAGIQQYTLFSAADEDEDGLSDEEEIQLGTDPAVSDTDGDALRDGWEVKEFMGLKGCHPLRKDVVVIMDYMVHPDPTKSIAPSADVLERAKQVFREAPVTNVDGSRGITLHIKLRSRVSFMEKFAVWDDLVHVRPVAEWPWMTSVTCHYGLWAWTLEGLDWTGAADIPGVTFVIALGGLGGGSEDQKLGTLLHELGHSLGLNHGGCDGVNYKPNYFSVMNYLWQLDGVAMTGGPRYGYHDCELDDLNEGALVEANGLGSRPAPPGSLVPMLVADVNGGVPAVRALVDSASALDWNGAGGISSGAVPCDINADGSLQWLYGRSDWDRMVFDGNGIIGSVERNVYDTFRIRDEKVLYRMSRPAVELPLSELKNLSKR